MGREAVDIMSELQNLALKTLAQQTYKEVLELKRIIEQKERDWLTISQETDEVIAALKSDNEEMKAALLEVVKVFDSENKAIIDTVWVSGNSPETLRDFCSRIAVGHTYAIPPDGYQYKQP